MDFLVGEELSLISAVFRTASGLPSDVQWVVAVWFLMVGGCFGSLMNVIVYRWPAGMSIVAPGSRCPRCLHAIRLYDNVPVLSWVLLGARCRDCRLPIPIRYPLVEAAVAVLFFVFFIVELIDGGSNLPTGSVTLSARQLWGIYALQMLLICMLICAALIEFDEKKLPAKLVWPPLLIAVVATVWWPELRPASAVSVGALGNQWQAAILGVAVGAIAGGIAGRITDATSAAVHGEDGRLSCTLLAAVVGVFVGWSAVVAICLAVCLCVLIAKVERRFRSRVRTLPASCYLALVTLSFLLYWRMVDEGIQMAIDR